MFVWISFDLFSGFPLCVLCVPLLSLVSQPCRPLNHPQTGPHDHPHYPTKKVTAMKLKKGHTHPLAMKGTLGHDLR